MNALQPKNVLIENSLKWGRLVELVLTWSPIEKAVTSDTRQDDMVTASTPQVKEPVVKTIIKD